MQKLGRPAAPPQVVGWLTGTADRGGRGLASRGGRHQGGLAHYGHGGEVTLITELLYFRYWYKKLATLNPFPIFPWKGSFTVTGN